MSAIYDFCADHKVNNMTECGFKRVLLFRPDNIGDCVLFSGTLKWIRRRWPDAHIDLMVQPHAMNLFELCPHVDRVLSVERLMPWLWMQRRGWKGAWLTERMFEKEWAKHLLPYPAYDLVICPVSAPAEQCLDVVRRIHAPEKWGCGGFQLNAGKLKNENNRPEKVFTEYYVNTEAEAWQNEFVRTGNFLKKIGIDFSDINPEFWLSQEDHEYAERIMPKDGAAGLFIGGFHSWRRWSAEKWRSLIATIDPQLPVVIFGSSQDCSQASEIASSADLPGGIVNLCGKTSLRQLAACIGSCRVFVSNESCGLHMAVAQGIPTVGIMGGHHYGRYYPWGKESVNRAARVEMDCYHCNGVCRYDDYRCIKDISVDAVWEELKICLKN